MESTRIINTWICTMIDGKTIIINAIDVLHCISIIMDKGYKYNDIVTMKRREFSYE